MMNFQDTLRFLPMLHANTKLAPNLIGHTGIGKTELAAQYARMINFRLIVVSMAQLEPSDFIGLYKTTADGRTMTCAPNWLPFDDGIVPEEAKDKAQVFNNDLEKPLGWVVLLDEINRGHEDIRQAMYQFITTLCIHTYKAPAYPVETMFNGEKITLPKTVLIATSNPASKYECYEFDAALTNRFSNIKFRPDVMESLEYLEGKHGPNMMLKWLNTDKGLVELGDDDFEITDLKMTPRIVENALQLWNVLENEAPKFQRQCLETIMPKDKVASFISFVDEVKHINYVDVINGVKGEKVKNLLKNNRRDILSTIVTDMGALLETWELDKTVLKNEVKGAKVTEKEAIKNMAQFLSDCPAELTTVLLNLLNDTFEKKTCIVNDPDFYKPLADKLKNFKDVMRECKKKT